MNMIKAHGLIIGSMTTTGLIVYAVSGNLAVSMLSACCAGVVATFVIIYLGLTGRL